MSKTMFSGDGRLQPSIAHMTGVKSNLLVHYI